MSKASGDDLVSLYSVYLKPTSGGTAARGARGNGAAWSSTDSSLSDSCTAIDISSDNIHDVANYETGGERKEETVGDQQQEREGEATWERNEREEKDEEDEAQEEGEGYVTAEEWDSGGEEGEENRIDHAGNYRTRTSRDHGALSIKEARDQVFKRHTPSRQHKG